MMFPKILSSYLHCLQLLTEKKKYIYKLYSSLYEEYRTNSLNYTNLWDKFPFLSIYVNEMAPNFHVFQRY